MRYFQVFYNASESGLSGTPGFGIRTATEGIPESWLAALDADEQLKDYVSGDFQLDTREIFAHPERIAEFPRSYYFKKLVTDDKQVIWALARQVYVCFDFPFYRSRSITRGGNFINHVLVFDAYPGVEVFDLLFEKPSESSLCFLPKDYSPRVDNPEMLTLMLGKPQRLPMEELPVAIEPVTIPSDSFTLYFQLLDLFALPVTAETPAKPVVIKAPAKVTGAVIAGLMRLLPEKYAKDVTFFSNYQENGAAKGFKLTFVNEYYSYTVYTSACHFINLIENRPQPTALEMQFRASLEKVVEEADPAALRRWLHWIPSGPASAHLNQSQALNLAMFTYVEEPLAFTLELVDQIPELLSALLLWVDGDVQKGARLNELLVARQDEAATPEDWKVAVSQCERVRLAGLNVQPALDNARVKLTTYLSQSAQILMEGCVLLEDNLISRYVDVEHLPSLEKIWAKIVELDASFETKKWLMRLIEPSATGRVTVFANAVKKDVSQYAVLIPYLDDEHGAADQVDWVGILQEDIEKPELSNLFFDQIVRRFRGQFAPDERLHYWARMAQQNPEIKEMLLGGADKEGYYSAALSSLISSSIPKEMKVVCVQSDVLDVLQPESRTWAEWNLYNLVLQGKVPEDKVTSFFEMAKRAKDKDALLGVKPFCLKQFQSEEEITNLVDTLLNWDLMTVDAMADEIGHMSSIKPEARIRYLVHLVNHLRNGKDIPYLDLVPLAQTVGITESMMPKVMENHFPKAHSDFKRMLFKSGVSSFFKAVFAKKEKRLEVSEEESSVALEDVSVEKKVDSELREADKGN